MAELKKILFAAGLPAEWNRLAEVYFQQTPFLIHAEKYNPCRQRYYLFYEGSELVAGGIVYTLRLDIFTYLRIKSPVKMHIAGVPCSVSCPGIFGKSQYMQSFKEAVYKAEAGFVLFLNLPAKGADHTSSCGSTLPSVCIENQFHNWDHYIASLRSHYRRRIRQLELASQELRISQQSCPAFNSDMYSMYLEVYRRSKAKLEKLSIDFFKNLPPEFDLFVCYKGSEVIGWNIALTDKDKYYFFLGGIDYRYNDTFQTYLGLLLHLVKQGIEKGAQVIDLGQTAEIPKMRMGGKLSERFMEARHSNKILNKVLRLSGGSLEYKRKLENTHVMKEATV